MVDAMVMSWCLLFLGLAGAFTLMPAVLVNSFTPVLPNVLINLWKNSSFTSHFCLTVFIELSFGSGVLVKSSDQQKLVLSCGRQENC